MRILLPSQRGIQQPSGKVEADRSSPLLRGYNRLYCLNGHNNYNLISNAPVTGAPVPYPTVKGQGSHFDGASTSAITADSISHSGVWAGWALVKSNTTTGLRHIFAMGAGTTYSFLLRQNGSNYEAYQHTDVASPYDRQALDTSGVDTTKLQFVGAQWDGSYLYVYRDGRQVASVAITNMDRAATDYYIGKEPTLGTTYYWYGEILLQGFAPRILSDCEWRELAANPFQVLKPEARKVYIDTVAAGSFIGAWALNRSRVGAGYVS